MIDDLVGNAQLRPTRQWFAAAGIAHKARVSAARDLDAKALSLAEVVGGWPDLDRDMQACAGYFLRKSPKIDDNARNALSSSSLTLCVIALGTSVQKYRRTLY